MELRQYIRPLFASIIALYAGQARAATFTWGSTTGSWATGAAWVGGAAPTGTNAADVLVFTGNVGSAASPTTYTSTNNVAAVPFLLKDLVFTATDAAPTTSGLSHTITGSAIRFAGASPSLMHNGTANINLDTPIQLAADLIIGGTGTGRVTANNAFSGLANITKTGTSEFRFGTLGAGASNNASGNTWMGKLIIQEGIVRFNNNAQAGATALRANPVEFIGNGTLSMKRDGGDESSNFNSSLRTGTLMGTTGTVLTTLEGSPTSNFDIIITALINGTFGGSITIPAPTTNGVTTGNDGGALTIRGTGVQTLTGTLNIYKDVVVGNGSTLVLANTGSLGNQTRGSVTMAGGTLVLDNTSSNIALIGRLRDGTATSTTVETIGGGTLRLIGNSFGSSELTGRLQLGAFASVTNETKPRSGHLNIEIVHTAGSSAQTELRFQSYSRDATFTNVPQLSTVDFSATNLAGSALTLGASGNNPRIYVSSASFTPPLVNGLLSTTTTGVPNASIGWATTKEAPLVAGADNTSFAGYDSLNGIIPVPTVPWTTSLNPSANARITGNAITPAASNYLVNSIRMTPTLAGQALTLPGTGHLVSTAFLLAGGIDYAINATSSGGIAGNSPRFFQIPVANLTVNASLAITQQPIVKGGNGTLILTNAANNALTDSAVLAINGGAVRATPGSSLPPGEIRFRGGQLEIAGGGTFNRSLGYGFGAVNWSGARANPDPFATNPVIAVDEDRGSGGFAAFGAEVTLDLNTLGTPDIIYWESLGFVRSGYSLVFGSRSATHRVTWSDNLSLSEADPDLPALPNSIYNARDIRVVDNVSSSGDWARISGTISGKKTNDLLKTGSGQLELTGTNTYEGATIVREGTLFVNGNNATSFLHDVMSGGTLGGNGILGDIRIGSGGTLAPGAQSGLASILSTKNLILIDGTSQFRVDIGGLTAGGDTAAGFDRVSVTGSVILGNSDLILTLTNGYVPADGNIFFLILNDLADPVQGQFSDGTFTTDGAHPFAISYTANSATGLMTGGNDIAVQYIPEPSSTLLLGLGALALARRRRK
jgi:fibronectin-binding autotransporter adhesin